MINQEVVKTILKNKYFRIVLALLPILILLLNAQFRWFRLPWSNPEAMEAVPRKSAVILQSPNWFTARSQFSKLPYRKGLEATLLFEKWQKDGNEIEKYFNQGGTDKELQKKLSEVAASIVTDASDFQLLHIFEGLGNHFDIKSFVEKAAAGKTIEETWFNGTFLYCIKGESGNNYTFSYNSGLLLVSPKTMLVEYGIDQLAHFGTNVTRSSHFRKVFKESSTGDHEMKLLVNSASLPSFLSIIVPAEKQNEVGQFAGLFDWVGLGLDFTTQSLNFRGSITPEKSQMLYALGRQSTPVNSSIATVVPDNVAFMLYQSADNFDKLCRAAGVGSRSDFSKLIQPLTDKECAFVLFESATKNFRAEKVVLVKLEDADAALKKIQNYKDEKEPKTLNHLNYTLRQLPVSELFEGYYGSTASPVSNPWYVIIDNYAVFANSSETLKIWIDKCNFGQTLANSPLWQQITDNNQSLGCMALFVRSEACFQLLNSYTKDILSTGLLQHFSDFKHLTPLYMGFTAMGNRLSINGKISFEKTQKVAANIAWRTDLLAPCASRPFVLKNPLNGKSEVMIQDTENRLYLINTDGQIMWNRRLDGRLLSEIFLIDYYGNGESQFVFNTADKVYFLNRKGEDLTRQMDIPEKAIAGMLSVNYGPGTRFYIGCTNNNIYGFEKDGSPLDGWSPQSDGGKIRFPMQHFKDGDKDFIGYIDQAGTFFFFDRNGKRRFSPTATQASYNSTFGIDEKARRIAIGDKSGYIHILNFDGQKFSLHPDIGAKTSAYSFAYTDVIGDERKDYILQCGAQVGCYYYDGKDFKKSFVTTLPLPVANVFPVQISGQDKGAVGCTSFDKKKIFLLDGTGKLYPDFPLAGSTTFTTTDLFDDGTTTVITGLDQSVYVYRLR